MQILLIVGIPLLLAGVLALVRTTRTLGYINMAGHLVVLALSLLLLMEFTVPDKVFSPLSFIYVDALSGFFIFVISVVSFAASLYSVEYIANEVKQGAFSARKARMYYSLFNFFAFSMYLVTVVNNLGMLWVAIELTTLVSAFLVGFYNTKTSIEAAWKYLIICSVGIIFALLGTILFSYALSVNSGIRSLNWTDMVAAANTMDKNVLRIAFIFIVVGYGTKAGLAPMHTWLPDAHSQAIAPISALLSGVLLETALYAILRFGIIVNRGIGPDFFNHLMILFGLVSLGISAVFILAQRDLKRLLAYSSIENVGIIAVGFGLGAPLAMFGALFHILNHGLAKSLMFFGAGNIVNRYQSHNMHTIKGVISSMPFTGLMFLLGTFILAGFPPFSTFTSELMIIIAAFKGGSYLTAALLLGFVVIIFGAMIYQFGRMIFGNAPENMPPSKEPASGKLAFLFLFIPICVMGVAIPGFLQRALESALKVIYGV